MSSRESFFDKYGPPRETVVHTSEYTKVLADLAATRARNKDLAEQNAKLVEQNAKLIDQVMQLRNDKNRVNNTTDNQ